ncbi:L-fucose:H+ symporter permease [Mangrovimonas sp. AS39]|uniref:L-fucose:H+ symporter permease n=1 Tax=Mangrovimonas futianensis TaxID=2895523 RepID=UPI001E35DEDF|nr:L-fucose:H+ symporter permease [Mangrovimonas futianensis]MCF1192838.1 L-fucose:H+ symporter permease [Mangrovimonas futianensis]MCF1196560.1 L-fucose:H+ symporter permease [Mangrovimonas futianensis]
MKTNISHSILPKKNRFVFFLLALCFMGWGLANNITDPLVKVFKNVFGELSTFQASLIQFTFYFGYFCMAIPGALISKRYSFKIGVLVGLGLYIAGCFLLYPATLAQNFLYFCLSFYILACGLGILETNANPFVLLLGPKETATERLNLAQSFNPVGSILGVFMCQILIMAQLPTNTQGDLAIPAHEIKETLGVIIYPYLIVGSVLILVWVLIAITKMPDLKRATTALNMKQTVGQLLRKSNYRFAVLAQFFYVGAQISVWTYTNFYLPEQIGASQELTLQYHTVALICFGIFRWIFTSLMHKIAASKLLLVVAIVAILLSLNVILIGGMVGAISLIAISACMSLMFPTIFGMGCEGLNEEETKVGASGLIMAILGGAVLTPLQGSLIDFKNVSFSYVVPLICFLVIALYAAYHKKLLKKNVL